MERTTPPPEGDDQLMGNVSDSPNSLDNNVDYTEGGNDEDQHTQPTTPENNSSLELYPPPSTNRNSAKEDNDLPDLGLPIEFETTYNWKITSYTETIKEAQANNNQVKSAIFEIDGEPWRILFFPQGNPNTRETTLHSSIFLEYAGDKDSKDDLWHQCLHFSFIMANPNDETVYESQEVHRRFDKYTGDWGFNRFVNLQEMTTATADRKLPLVVDDQTLLKIHVRLIKDESGILWHTFENYDSKLMTGFVGLKNQGATCYMNSLLQSLYFTTKLRKAVYQIPVNIEERSKSVALALQRLFFSLQKDKEAVDTRELTKSFGWDTADSFAQHDVQEFNRVLQDTLEAKLKGTTAQGTIEQLFAGKFKFYTKCLNVDFESSRIERFDDVQLIVRGCKSIQESLDKYTETDELVGENKYQAEGFGLQDAKRGAIFESFPPVLHLHLRRFVFDYERMCGIKINDRFEFPEVLNLEPWLSKEADRSIPPIFKLHGVLVHIGDTGTGHYLAFIKPTANGKWFKFDDDRVTPATLKEVLDDNFGENIQAGPPQGVMSSRQQMRFNRKAITNAYMLVYVREHDVMDVIGETTDVQIPQHLNDLINNEAAEYARQKQESEMLAETIPITVVTMDMAKTWSGFDLCNLDSPDFGLTKAWNFRRRKDSTWADFKAYVAEKMSLPEEQLQFWRFYSRENKTIRVEKCEDNNPSMPLEATNGWKIKNLNLRLWIQSSKGPEVDMHGKTRYFPDDPQMILLFIKFYDPHKSELRLVDTVFVNKSQRPMDYIPQYKEMLGLPPTSELQLYEEIKSDMIEPVRPKASFAALDLDNSDIITIQIQEPVDPSLEFPSVIDYYKFIGSRIYIDFYPKSAAPTQVARRDRLPPVEGSFRLLMSKVWTYEKLVSLVAKEINLKDPSCIRLCTAVRDSLMIRSVINKTHPKMMLQDLLTSAYGLGPLFYYEVLPFSLAEMESKRPLRLTFVDQHHREAGYFDLLPSRKHNIGDVLEMLLQKEDFKALLKDTKQVRLFEAPLYREYTIIPNDRDLSKVPDNTPLMVEEIPAEEINYNGPFVGIFHFHKNIISGTHSIPFRMTLKSEDETWGDFKKRLQQQLGFNDKDFAKIKVVCCSITNPNDGIEFNDTRDASPMRQFDWTKVMLGLNHPDRNLKTHYQEKSIRIQG